MAGPLSLEPSSTTITEAGCDVLRGHAVQSVRDKFTAIVKRDNDRDRLVRMILVLPSQQKRDTISDTRSAASTRTSHDGEPSRRAKFKRHGWRESGVLRVDPPADQSPDKARLADQNRVLSYQPNRNHRRKKQRLEPRLPDKSADTQSLEPRVNALAAGAIDDREQRQRSVG